MRTLITSALLLVVLSGPSLAQQGSFQDSLLDRMTGSWVLHGRIEGRETTHDVTVTWVLAHQYLQIHEVSREKNADGTPAYEAIVYLGWDAALKQYACLWLDGTGGGGLNGQAIGHGRRSADALPLIFTMSDGSRFHTTFAYERGKDVWQWVMDGEDHGTLQPFARLSLTRNEDPRGHS